MLGDGRERNGVQMSALQVSCEGHRLQDSASAEFVDIQSPFSNFDFVEKRFAKSQTIHRCFSLARSANCCCCVVEPLVDVGLLDDDTKEMRRLGYHVATTNFRLSFWKKPASSKQEFNALAESDLFGYMIVRCDGLDPADPQWYVFEAVLSKYDHPHNCVSMPGEYNLAVCGRNFRMRGVMFCQQNKLNKRCAQVSLRALLSRIVPGRDVAYSRINAIAARVAKSSGETFNPSDGMSVKQIEQVLTDFGIRYKDVDYPRAAKSPKKLARLKKEIPYTKFMYAGAESGLGALLGFKVHGGDEKSRHIIPIFGHTFNKDSWVSDARKFYFNDKDQYSAYMPSDSWTSSFIGHDDNLGPDFCVPRAYVLPEDVDYVVELYRPEVKYSGAIAEAIAFQVLKHLQNSLQVDEVWAPRLIDALDDGNVVLRSVSLSCESYIAHLHQMRAWDGTEESRVAVDGFSQMKLPSVMWMVEVSLPQLFPANEAKIGEIVLDATVLLKQTDFAEGKVSRKFLQSIQFIRLPSAYYFPKSVSKSPEGKIINFFSAPSAIKSHVGVIHL